MVNKLSRILKTVTDYGICIYLVLILGIMPYYNQEGYAHIGTDKARFFDTTIKYTGRLLLPVAGVYLIICAYLNRKELRNGLRGIFSVTDHFAIGYGGALLISWGFSNYRENALWGAKGWFMGLLPQLALVLCYLMVSKLWTPRKWVVYLALTVSWTVFLLGWLNRAGLDPLSMGTDNTSFISTIGNINWYCGYMVSILFVGVGLLWQFHEGNLPWKLLLMVYVFVGFGSLLAQGSDSGLLALAVVVFVMFALSASESVCMRMLWLEMVLLGGTCVITYIMRAVLPNDSYSVGVGAGLILVTGWRPFAVTIVSVLGLALVDWSIKQKKYPDKALSITARVAVCLVVTGVSLFVVTLVANTLSPNGLGPLSGSALFTFNDKWGSSRGATWQAGWMCFVEQNYLHKLVGVGPDAMSFFEYDAGSAGLQSLLEENFGSAVLTNAHNEWLTVLVDVGILGLITFVGMMLTGIWRFLKKGRNPITFACGLCLLAYTVNNMFSFQQSMNTSTIFAIFGIGGAFLRAEMHKNVKEKSVKNPNKNEGNKYGREQQRYSQYG